MFDTTPASLGRGSVTRFRRRPGSRSASCVGRLLWSSGMSKRRATPAVADGS
jgi:hypothetical protein